MCTGKCMCYKAVGFKYLETGMKFLICLLQLTTELKRNNINIEFFITPFNSVQLIYSKAFAIKIHEKMYMYIFKPLRS